MKKTQKVLNAIKYIDDSDMSLLELERLVDELDIMIDTKADEEEFTITQTELDEEKQSYINNQI